MRAWVDVARAWHSANERPFFYAESRNGAVLASWTQAACGEVSAYGRFVDYASVLPDFVKAFEGIPHRLLVQQAKRFSFSITFLRLSIVVYRLCRDVGVDGVLSSIMVGTRAITSRSVFATIEKDSSCYKP